MKRKRLIAIAVPIGLVALGVASTFVVMTRERICKPLELAFRITARTNPETGAPWDRGPERMRPPDPTGWVLVETDGKRRSEGIALRRNTFGFRGRFYAKTGVRLRMGSKIEIQVLDKDLAGAQLIGKIIHTVKSVSFGGAVSENGAVEVTYTCHTD